MSVIGTVVIAVVMLCAVAGAVGACFNDQKGIGKEFIAGLHAIGPIFIPVAGIMAALPYLSHLVEVAVGPLFATIGADPAMAATSIIAVEDKPGPLRALEIAGYIGLMLAGAFPLVYMIQQFLARPIEWLGQKIGLERTGAAGILATVANILAMFRLVREMRPKDKVLNISFAVCAAFLFGDHLSFTANFQPNLILPVLLGKLGGGMVGFLLAHWLCVPKALELEQLQST